MKQALFALVLALQLVDIATTLYVLKRGGVEANPLMRRLMEAFGSPEAALVATKFAFVVLLGALYESIPVWSFGLMAAIYVWVAYNNGKVIRAIRDRT